MREPEDFDFYKWNAHEFINARPFRVYAEELKRELVGRELSSICTMSCIFNDYENEGIDVWEPDENYINLDEPAVFDFGGLRLEIWFYNASHVKVGLDTLTMTEKSYQNYPWRDVSRFFKNGIGARLTDIVLSTNDRGFYDSVFQGDGNRPDGGDYFGLLYLAFDNGAIIAVGGRCEYMQIYEWNAADTPLFPGDARIRLRKDLPENRDNDFVAFCPHGADKMYHDREICIYVGDFAFFEFLLKDVLGKFDIYGCTEITLEQWRFALERWELFCGAGSFDTAFDRFCGIDRASWTVGNRAALERLNNRGADFWKRRDSLYEMLCDLRRWTQMLPDACGEIEARKI